MSSMRNSKYLDLMLATSILAYGNTLGGGTRVEDIDFSKKEAPVPKGAKKYYFNSNGGYCHEDNGLSVFSCIAISKKNAYKKFNKWKQQQKAAA